MSFESAFYNKYAYLTDYTARELLQTLLALHNLTKTIDEILTRTTTPSDKNNSKLNYESVCLIQIEFLQKREILCVANEKICQHIRLCKERVDAAHTNIACFPGVPPNTRIYIKSKKHHFDQITEVHKSILDKQDARLSLTIFNINNIKAKLHTQTHTTPPQLQ